MTDRGHPADQWSGAANPRLEDRRPTGVVTVVRSAALALDRYHARNGVHGAFCAEALVVGTNGEVTILPPSPASGADLYPYWSPQRRAGEAPRVSDDLYALGVIAVELLQAADRDEADADAARRLGRAEAVMRTLTSWSPSERPASGAELVRALDAATHDAGAGPRHSTGAGSAVRGGNEPASAAASRVALARRAHRLAQTTPPRPVRPPRPRQVRAPLGKGHYPDMPLPTGWVAALVLILCSVYLLPLYFMLFPPR